MDRAENLDPVSAEAAFSQTAALALDLAGEHLSDASVNFQSRQTLAAFDGFEDFAGNSAGASGQLLQVGGIDTGFAATTLTSITLPQPEWTGTAAVQLEVQRTGTTTINGPGNPDVQTELWAGGQLTVSYTYIPAQDSLETPPPVVVSTPDPDPGGDIRITSAGANTHDASTAYEGPVAGLEHQYLFTGSGDAALTATAPDTFLKGGSGDDALTVSGGSNVLDGAAGSNFLTGGTGADGGADTFFVDARDPSQTTWSTIVNFHAGDMATIFGFDAGMSVQTTAPIDGTAAYRGFTIHAATAGTGTPVNASLTFANLDPATAAQHLVSTTGTLPGGISYLLIQYT